MKEKDKKLLFIDISARLPHGVKLKIWLNDGTTEEGTLDIKHNYADVLLNFFYYNKIKDCKPYLRPMSSMTEEERWDFGRIFNSFEYLKLELLENGLSFHEIYDITGMCDVTWNELNTAIDWLNSHHFDYRGLIEKGLAIEVTEQNNPYK